MPDKFVGRKLGPYTLEYLLGKGGMGTVYRAIDDAGNAVAVKILPVDEESATSTMAARFKREIDACRGTKSIHVIQLFEAGVEPDCHWYSMEVLEGDTLQQLMKARGRMPHSEVARICREVALALEHIHERGIIHRDLKPGNIMIVRSGRTVLMDFGLAKVADRTRITKTGHGLGTPRYMAPEMLLAKPATPATDIYQLGVILYELLTGQTVVKAKSFATLAHELTRVYPPPILELDPSLDASLNTLVFNCIEKDQKRRYQSAAEFRADLDRAFAGEPIERRGQGKMLKLGESSGEISTDEFTAELPASSPKGRPLPPDSRGSGRNPRITTGNQTAVRPSSSSRPRISSTQPRASSSFSSVAPTEEQPLPPWVAGLLAQRQRLLLPALGLLGGVVLLWLLLGGEWSGDTGLDGEVQVRVSPAGAELRFRTRSEVPGEVRLFRYLDDEGGGEDRLDSATRVYRAADAAPGRVHLVTIERLVPGRSYAAEVHFPNGNSFHRVRFQIPERAAIQDLRLERGRGADAEVHFRMPFAVEGRLRQGPPEGEGALPLPGEASETWKVPLPLEDPFAEVQDVYLDLEGAAGWRQTFGPYDFPGLDGEVRVALEALDVTGILAEIEAGRRQGTTSSVLIPLREKMREHHIPELLQRIRSRVGAFFASEVAFERKLGLFHALQRLAPVDFYCGSQNLPDLLEVQRLTAGFLDITRRPSFEDRNGTVDPDQVPIRVVRREGAKEALLPAGVDAQAYQRGLLRPVRGLDLSPRPQGRITYQTSLPTPLPKQVTLSIYMGNFAPDYYLELEVNGALTLLLHTQDPGVVLGSGTDTPGVEQAVVRLAADLPTQVLRPGRNRIVASLRGFGPVSGPTWVHQLDVYYRRGGR